jgi:hypothetical protein
VAMGPVVAAPTVVDMVTRILPLSCRCQEHGRNEVGG